MRCLNDVRRNALFQRFFDDRRIVRVQEHVALTFVQIGFVLGAGRFFNAVRVVQQHAEIANAPDAGF